MSNTLKTMAEMQYFDFSFEPGKEIFDRISINRGEPLVSVITTCSRNSGHKYLNQMYNSLKSQTFPYWEWIIVSNGEEPIIDEIVTKDKRIKYFINKAKNKNKAKLFAAKNAKSDIVFYFEENDLIDKTMLECGYFALFFSPEASMTYSNMVEFGKKELLVDRNIDISDFRRKKIILPSVFIRKNELLGIDGEKNYPNETMLENSFFITKDLSIKMNFYGYWHRNLKNDVRLNMVNDTIATLSNGELNTLSNRSSDEICDNNCEVDYKDTPKNINIGKNPIVPKDNKKRILLILPWMIIGGADIFCFNLIKGLKNKGYEISIITTQKSNYVLRQKVEQYVDEYFDVTSFLKRKDWASFIAYIIKSRRIKLVFISNSFYGYYALPWLKCKFKNIPFVDYIHAENMTLRNGGFPKDSNAVSNYIDETYTCTKHLKELMLKDMNRNINNIKPIYIGADVNYFDPKIKLVKSDELRKKYLNNKIILIIGRIVNYKRPIFAINVIKKISKVKKNVRLIIVGDGIALPSVKKYVKDNNLQDLVDFYGYQEDVRPFYNVSNATIICSLREGLALVTYESLSMGVPIVSADVGGQKELIGKDCGFLIKPFQKPQDQFDLNYSDEEILQYADALIDIIDREEKTNIKELCRNKVVNKFSINKMIDTLDKQFTNLIKNGSKVNGDLLKNTELAERFLLVNSILESKEEGNKNGIN